MKKIVSIKKQISDTAVQLQNDGLWKSLDESDFISFKALDGIEMYIRVFGKESDYTGIGIYTTPVDYALSETIKNDPTDEEMVSPGTFFQKGFIGLFGNEEKHISFSFRKFVNGYLYDITDIDKAEFLLEVMQCLSEAFALYDKKGYPKGFVMNLTPNNKVLLSQPKTDFLSFRSSVTVTFKDSEYLSDLKKMPVKDGFRVFIGTLIPPFLLPCEDGAHFPCMGYILDAESREILKTYMIKPDLPLAYQYADLIFYLSEKCGKPAEIFFCHPRYDVLISDLCLKSGIRLTFSDDITRFVDQKVIMNLAEKLIMADENAEEPSHETVYSDEPLTYKISVSAGSGCYRHIEMSANSTLEDLHNAIQWAFDFDNDHAYAFFMDNDAWSNNGYYCDGIDEHSPLAGEHTLFEVLEEKKPFLYLFDFGDEWRFQCRLLSVKEKECKEATIVRSVGQAPEQYPDYDDEDF